MSKPLLIHLGRFTAGLGRPEMVSDTPLGQRIVAGITGARLEGERITAVQRGTSAADWLVIGSDGTVFIDVRIALRTDDGAFIYMAYKGRGDWSGGPMTGPTFSAPCFETGDPRYAWLNSVQAVGRGTVGDGGASYELYEVR